METSWQVRAMDLLGDSTDATLNTDSGICLKVHSSAEEEEYLAFQVEKSICLYMLSVRF